MADIKTKDVIKGTIKTLDKSAVAGERMRTAYVKTIEKAEHSVTPAETTAEEYGSDRITTAAERVTDEAVYQFRRKGQNGFRDAKRNIEKVKTNVQKLKDLKSTAKKTKAAGKAGKQTVKAAQNTVKTTKAMGKTAVKTAQATGKAAVKTAEATAKTAKATAKATVQTAKATAAAAKAAVKATIAAVKLAAKAIAAAVKAIIAGVKALAAIIAAGGWVAVVVIIVICVIALIVGSCFGIFFSNEDTGGAQTMQSVITEVNNEYLAEIEALKGRYTYDEIEISGAVAAWPEVLSVYSVKTTTDPDHPQEVATVDDSKKALIRELFWLMNTLTARTETKTETVITQTEDGHGNIVETETTVTKTYLYIVTEHKTAEDMAAYYGFNEDQRQQLSELLSEENRSMWDGVLSGITA